MSNEGFTLEVLEPTVNLPFPKDRDYLHRA